MPQRIPDRMHVLVIHTEVKSFRKATSRTAEDMCGLASSVARTVCETFHIQREENSTAAADADAGESRLGLAAVAWRDNPDSKPGLTEPSLPQGFPLWPYCQQLCQRGTR